MQDAPRATPPSAPYCVCSRHDSSQVAVWALAQEVWGPPTPPVNARPPAAPHTPQRCGGTGTQQRRMHCLHALCQALGVHVSAWRLPRTPATRIGPAAAAGRRRRGPSRRQSTRLRSAVQAALFAIATCSSGLLLIIAALRTRRRLCTQCARGDGASGRSGVVSRRGTWLWVAPRSSLMMS